MTQRNWHSTFSSSQIDVLTEIVAAMGDKMEVYLDSGVRTGADVVKALALGARAVFVGWPVLCGLAYDGKQGVQKVLRILRDELEHTMRLLGCSDVNHLCELRRSRELILERLVRNECRKGTLLTGNAGNGVAAGPLCIKWGWL
ncbi:hypothetical protein MRX96_015648 [Rhipicephalus microplus]